MEIQQIILTAIVIGEFGITTNQVAIVGPMIIKFVPAMNQESDGNTFFVLKLYEISPPVPTVYQGPYSFKDELFSIYYC